MRRRHLLSTGAIAALAGCSADEQDVDRTDEQDPTERLPELARRYGVNAGSSEETNNGLDIFIGSDEGRFATIADLTGVAMAYAQLEEDGSLAVLVDGESPIGRVTIDSTWAEEYREREITVGEYMSKILETTVPPAALEDSKTEESDD